MRIKGQILQLIPKTKFNLYMPRIKLTEIKVL